MSFLFFPIGLFLAFISVGTLFRSARAYTDTLLKFAQNNNFKFVLPKINEAKSFWFFVITFMMTPNLIVYKRESFLDEVLKEGIRHKSYFFSTDSSGSAYYVYNLMKGEFDGRKIQIYNYQFQQSKWFTPVTYCQIFLRRPVESAFYLRPENFKYVISNILELQDIELEYQEFNKKYRVKATNHAFAFQVLDPTLMEELMKHEKISIMISHDSLIIAQFEELQPDQILKNLELGVKIANQIDKK